MSKKYRVVKIITLVIFSMILWNSKISFIEAHNTPTVKLSKTVYTNKNVTISLTFSKSDKIKTVKYVKGSHSKAYVNKKGTKLSISSQTARVTVSTNGTYTFYYVFGDGVVKTKRVTISNIDKTAPKMNPTYKVFNQKATVTLNGSDQLSGLSYARYIKGTLLDTASAKWNTKAKKMTDTKSFQVTSAGNYSILLVDKAGNKTVKKINVTLELKAVWISYLEYASAGVQDMTEVQFKSYISTVFENCKNKNLNTVIVQVRPSGDALYPSSYFPWSQYLTGTQGNHPGYDPMACMITEAHKRGLSFYAWINPYRVSASSTSIQTLSEDNQARIWRSSSDSNAKRNVLTYNGQLYYNPAKSEVRTLIVNGVKEIVKKYDVEGIVFDDYFYPNLGSKYASNFDYTEYKAYKLECEEKQMTPKSIVEWRRSNVNALLKRVKTAIKSLDKAVEFGVSPQGNISNLTSTSANYCDITTWLNSSCYVDFVSPQIYWSTTNSVSPYETVVKQWINLRKSNDVKLYLSLAVYKAGITKKEANALSPADLEWYTSDTNLKRQVQFGRKTSFIDGFMFYRYDNMCSTKAKSEIDNLLSIL